MPVARTMMRGELSNRLKENIVRGRAARKLLGQKLAEMSPHEIAKLPRSVLTRIGPDGIATMARVAAATDDALPASGRPPVRMQSRTDPPNRPWPIWLICCMSALLIIGLALGAGAIDRPLRWAIARSDFLNADTVGLCNRLDRWTEDCAFVVTGPGLGQDSIASKLGRDRNAVIIPPGIMHADGSLPIGAIVHIPRRLER